METVFWRRFLGFEVKTDERARDCGGWSLRKILLSLLWGCYGVLGKTFFLHSSFVKDQSNCQYFFSSRALHLYQPLVFSLKHWICLTAACSSGNEIKKYLQWCLVSNIREDRNSSTAWSWQQLFPLVFKTFLLPCVWRWITDSLSFKHELHSHKSSYHSDNSSFLHQGIEWRYL